MSQIDQFLSALKRSLKAKNIIYKDLAESLHLSESSVKRILSDKSISLERIEEICEACDLSFADICRSAHFEEDNASYSLSKEEERLLADNPRLLHYFVLLNDGMNPAKIEKDFEITSQESKKQLFQLDRLNLIELHPRDRVKLKNKSGPLRFRKDGAVGKILFTQAKNSYLHHDFEAERDYIRFSSLNLSDESLARLRKKLDKVVAEFQLEGNHDGEESQDVGVLLAFRPWKYTLLDAIKRREKKK